MTPPSLKRFAWLSIFAALGTIALKAAAWKLTGSVGLLSDALESIVNLAGAMMALAMLTRAACLRSAVAIANGRLAARACA